MHTLLPSRLSKLALGSLLLGGTLLAWTCLVSLFGAGGAALALPPALLIGGGGALTIAQLVEMLGKTLRSGSRRRAPLAHEGV